MSEPGLIRNRLLAVLAACAVAAGLRWSYPVSMPLAASVFVLAVAWPIKSRLDGLLPPVLSYAGTVLVLLLVLAAFGGATWVSVGQVVGSLAAREEQFRQLYEAGRSWTVAHGVPVPDGGVGFARLAGLAQALVSQAYDAVLYIGLVAVLVLLGLPEIPAFRRKLRAVLDERDRPEVFDAADTIARRFRSYVGVTVLVSLITGAACAAWAYAVGLDMALTWGLLNFLLNFIPVIGNVLGVIPPTLYALVQFGDWTMTAVVFAGYVLIQLVISNFIYPWMQGRGLALSPMAIIVAFSFWSWVWGIAGALLAIPLTGALVTVCEHFPSSAWLARLLSQD